MTERRRELVGWIVVGTIYLGYAAYLGYTLTETGGIW